MYDKMKVPTNMQNRNRRENNKAGMTFIYLVIDVNSYENIDKVPQLSEQVEVSLILEEHVS